MAARSAARVVRRGGEVGLAERLVAVAESILDEEGLEGLGLREVARRAGVTHGAPLRHFPSLAALCSEVATGGFRRLHDAVEDAEAAVPAGAGATARLAAAARAYVEGAVERPGVFALMFRPERLDRAHEGFRRESERAFEQLVRHVRAAQDAGWQAGLDTRRLAGTLWALVHGLATLWAQGAFAAAVRSGSLDDAIDTMMRLVLAGAPPAPERTPRETSRDTPRRARQRPPARRTR